MPGMGSHVILSRGSGPSKQGRVSGPTSKSGKSLVMLYMIMLINDFRAVEVICCLVSWGIKRIETSFWWPLPYKVRKLIIWAAVFPGKSTGFNLMGILPAVLYSFSQWFFKVLFWQEVAGSLRAWVLWTVQVPLWSAVPFPSLLFALTSAGQVIRVMCWLVSFPGSCQHDGVAGFRGRCVGQSLPSLPDPILYLDGRGCSPKTQWHSQPEKGKGALL